MLSQSIREEPWKKRITIQVSEEGLKTQYSEVYKSGYTLGNKNEVSTDGGIKNKPGLKQQSSEICDLGVHKTTNLDLEKTEGTGN